MTRERWGGIYDMMLNNESVVFQGCNWQLWCQGVNKVWFRANGAGSGCQWELTFTEETGLMWLPAFSVSFSFKKSPGLSVFAKQQTLPIVYFLL